MKTWAWNLRKTILTEGLMILMLLWRWDLTRIMLSFHSIACCRLSWDKDHSGTVLQPEEGDRSEADWQVRARAGRVWWGQIPPLGTFATRASTRSRAVSKPSQTGSHPRLISAPTASLNSLTTPSHPLSTVTFIQTISASEYSSIPCEWCPFVLWIFSFRLIGL